jgi:hypothetical protein
MSNAVVTPLLRVGGGLCPSPGMAVQTYFRVLVGGPNIYDISPHVLVPFLVVDVNRVA